MSSLSRNTSVKVRVHVHMLQCCCEGMLQCCCEGMLQCCFEGTCMLQCCCEVHVVAVLL